MHRMMMIIPAFLLLGLPVTAAACDPVPTTADALTLTKVAAVTPFTPIETTADDPVVKQVGTTAVLTAGRVPVHDLLRFLQATTGKPVLYASLERHAAKGLGESSTIEILETIRPLTVPIVRAILLTNYIHVKEVTLVDGSQVLHVTEERDASLRSIEQVEPAPPPEPTSNRPLLLDPDGSWMLDEDEMGLMVIKIENARVSDLLRLVERLLDDRYIEILPVGGKSARHLALRGHSNSITKARELIRVLDNSELWPRSGSTSGKDTSPTRGNAQGASTEKTQNEPG